MSENQKIRLRIAYHDLERAFQEKNDNTNKLICALNALRYEISSAECAIKAGSA